MTLIRTRFLKKMRKELEEKGYEITNDQWNQVVMNLEKEIEERLKKALNSHIFIPERNGVDKTNG